MPAPNESPEAVEKTKSFVELVRRKGMLRILGHWGKRGFLISMLLGSALITAMSLPYFDFETLPPFVIEKLPLRFETLWLASLRIHVAAAALSFPLCLALLTRASQRRAMLHRYLGRVTGVLVLFALVPSGIVLSFEAKGGQLVTAGFLLSAAIVATSMIVGARAARRRNLTLHARSMRHVLGQMSVAVISRAMIVGLDVAGLDPELVYVVALWLPVLASVLVVEWLSRRSNGSRKPLESRRANPDRPPEEAAETEVDVELDRRPARGGLAELGRARRASRLPTDTRDRLPTTRPVGIGS